MKKSTAVAVAISVIAILFTANSYAQMGMGYKWQGSGGWGMGTPYQRMYDPAKVETIKGTVDAVETVVPMKGMHKAVSIMVKTDKETIPVHLGPEWYIERLDTKILKGDAIEVRGSRVIFDGKPILIAAEIKKDKSEHIIVLRDDAGIPVWAGWKRK
jgi:hypothetical protein